MQFLLKIMQFAIVVGVVGSNGSYHWTPNGLAAGVVGMVAAAVATLVIVYSLALLRWLNQWRTLKQLRDQ